jgi:hypothetical protein
LVADGQPGVDPGYVSWLLTSFAEALDKNHHRHEARRMKARAAALPHATPSSVIVHVSDLAPHPKSVNK